MAEGAVLRCRDHCICTFFCPYCIYNCIRVKFFNVDTLSQFHCEEGQGDYVLRVDEPESCAYVITVHTMKICHHPYLKPSTPSKPVPISCSPVLTVEQYAEWEEEQEGECLPDLLGLIIHSGWSFSFSDYSVTTVLRNQYQN